MGQKKATYLQTTAVIGDFPLQMLPQKKKGLTAEARQVLYNRYSSPALRWLNFGEIRVNASHTASQKGFYSII